MPRTKGSNFISGLAVLALLLGSVLIARIWIHISDEGDVERLTAEITDLLQQERDVVSRLGQLQAAGPAPEIPSELLITSDTEAEARAVLEDSVLDAASRNDVFLQSFQQQGVPFDTSQNAIAFEVEAEATYQGIIGFLLALEGGSPPLAAHQLWIRSSSIGTVDRQETSVNARLMIWSVWERSVP